MKPPVSSCNKEPTDAGVEADPKARPHDHPTLEEKFPISGPIGRATGVVSAAARQEAKAIHAMIFGDKEAHGDAMMRLRKRGVQERV